MGLQRQTTLHIHQGYQTWRHRRGWCCQRQLACRYALIWSERRAVLAIASTALLIAVDTEAVPRGIRGYELPFIRNRRPPMRKCIVFLLVIGFLAAVPLAQATIFGSIRGIVHDPQHRPIAGADIKLQAATSAFSLATQTDQNGEFTFNPVAVGDYTLTVNRPGFTSAKQNVTVIAESSPVLHFPLDIAPVNETATVSAQPE